MERLSFSISGEDGDHVSFTLDELFGYPDQTSHCGGYDVRGTLSIHSGGLRATGVLWTSTGEIHSFGTSLAEAHERLSGTVDWTSCEGNLKLKLRFTERGWVVVVGTYREAMHSVNAITFEFTMDQTYLLSALKGLEDIRARYGGQRGIAGTGR